MSISTDAAALDTAVSNVVTALATLRNTCKAAETAGGRGAGEVRHVYPLLERAAASNLARPLSEYFTPPTGSSETCASICAKVSGT